MGRDESADLEGVLDDGQRSPRKLLRALIAATENIADELFDGIYEVEPSSGSSTSRSVRASGRTTYSAAAVTTTSM